MGWIRDLLRWWRTPHHVDPHPPRELARVPSPDGKREAVLDQEGSRHVKIYVHRSGSRDYRLYGRKIAVLIHCDDPGAVVATWEGPDALNIRGECDDLAAYAQVISTDGDSRTFSV